MGPASGRAPCPQDTAAPVRFRPHRTACHAGGTQALSEHPAVVATRAPNAHLLAKVGDIDPGLALDAGRGHGSEAVWLASRGWRVTAVDFSATALGQARATAQMLGDDVAERLDWVEGDLATWAPPPERFDLVVCLYVHIAGSVEDTVQRLAAGARPGGTLLLVGHRPVDLATGLPTPAAGQTQVSVDEAVGALDARRWRIVVAEERPRAATGSGDDAVVSTERLR